MTATRSFSRTVAALLIFVLLLYQLLYPLIRVSTVMLGGRGGKDRTADGFRPTPGLQPTGVWHFCNLSRKHHPNSIT